MDLLYLGLGEDDGQEKRGVIEIRKDLPSIVFISLSLQLYRPSKNNRRVCGFI